MATITISKDTTWSPSPSYTVGEIYNEKDVSIPEGYEFVAFRIPIAEEEYLSSTSLKPFQFKAYDILAFPRIVVRKKPVKVLDLRDYWYVVNESKKGVYKELFAAHASKIYGQEKLEGWGEDDIKAFRPPQAGEYFIIVGASHSTSVVMNAYPWDIPRLILK